MAPPIRPIRDIDSIKSLVDYIKKNLEKGYKLGELKLALINQGHSKINIEKAVKFIKEMEEAKKVKKQEPASEVLQTPVQVEEKKSLWQRIKKWFSS